MEGNKKDKKIIDRLSILLCISIVAFAGIEIYKQYAISKPTSIPSSAENIITYEEKSKEDNISNTLNQQENDSNNIVHSSQVNGSENDVANNESNGTSSEGSRENILSLYKKKPTDNQTFKVANMFPGDSVTKNYCVKVSYKDTVTVRFGVDTHKGYEKLSEAMKIKVVMNTTGKTMYDGYIKDMPTSLNHSLSFTDTSKSEELYYNIIAYLDTSVDNEYMNKELKVDFKWWVEREEEDNLEPPPETGDRNNILMLISVVAVSSLVLILIYSKRRKAVDYHG